MRSSLGEGVADKQPHAMHLAQYIGIPDRKRGTDSGRPSVGGVLITAPQDLLSQAQGPEPNADSRLAHCQS